MSPTLSDERSRGTSLPVTLSQNIITSTSTSVYVTTSHHTIEMYFHPLNICLTHTIFHLPHNHPFHTSIPTFRPYSSIFTKAKPNLFLPSALPKTGERKSQVLIFSKQLLRAKHDRVTCSTLETGALHV